MAIFQSKLDTARQKNKLAKKLDPSSQTAKFAESLLLRIEGSTEEADRMVADIISGKSHIEGRSYQSLIEKFVAKKRQG